MWRASLRAVVVLLVLWAIAGLGLGVLLVEPLNRVQWGGFKLGFWFAQQGSIYAFVLLTALYALWMDRIERRAVRNASKEGEESTP